MFVEVLRLTHHSPIAIPRAQLRATKLTNAEEQEQATPRRIPLDGTRSFVRRSSPRAGDGSIRTAAPPVRRVPPS